MEPRNIPTALRSTLEPDEEVIASAVASGVLVLVTGRRVLVGDDRRVYLNVLIEGIRRAEYDIDTQTQATLAIVPRDPAHRPQMLSVAPAHYAEAAAVLVALGERLVCRRAG
jgi:hypothetical protein